VDARHRRRDRDVRRDVGFGFVVGGPAMQSIVPNLIREGELSTAMALNSMPMTIGRIIGPASGAYLAAHLGSAAGFAVSAALHLVFAIFLVAVRFPHSASVRQSEWCRLH
jgi:MFS family permease